MPELTQCHRERLNYLADVIEIMPARFNMSIWLGVGSNRGQEVTPELLHDCGTSACMGGTAQALWFKGYAEDIAEEDVGAHVGLNSFETDKLFYPEGVSGGSGPPVDRPR